MLTSGMENGHGFCLRATGSPPFVTGPGSLSAGTECRVDGGRRRRGGGAVAVQSADVLSRWHVRVQRGDDFEAADMNASTRRAWPGSTGRTVRDGTLGIWLLLRSALELLMPPPLMP